MKLRFQLLTALIICVLSGLAGAKDIYISPEGAGDKSGSSLENSLAASESSESLQKAWDMLAPGDTLLVAPGSYNSLRVTLTGCTGKSATETKTIKGIVKDGKSPEFISTWGKNDANKGIDLITIPDNASWWKIENIDISKYRIAVTSGRIGRVSNGQISNVHATGVREGFIINGGATATNPEIGSHDIVFENCSVVHYVKRGFRFRNGVYNITVKDCLADAGGIEWATEPFHMSYCISGGSSGVYDHDITFINCVAKNNYHKTTNSYWNADGFCAERNVYNLKYIDCISLDNTDGGWDDKSANPLLIGCFASRNKLNYRFWGAPDQGVVMINCIASYAFKRGGSGHTAGLWTAGKADLYNCSLVGNPLPIAINDYKVTPEQRKATKVFVKDSIMTIAHKDDSNIQILKQEGNIVMPAAGMEGEALAYSNPAEAKKLNKPGKDYDSSKYGAAKGYNSSVSSTSLSAKAATLQPAIVKKGKALPAKKITVFHDKYASGWYLGGWKGGNMSKDKSRGALGSKVCLKAFSKNGDKSGGAKFQTKRTGADVILSEREPANWALEFYINTDGSAYEKLTINALSLDKSVKGKEIAIPAKFEEGNTDWQKVTIPLKDFLKDPAQEFSSFCGFFIRGFAQTKKPVYLDEISIVPLP